MESIQHVALGLGVEQVDKLRPEGEIDLGTIGDAGPVLLGTWRYTSLPIISDTSTLLEMV